MRPRMSERPKGWFRDVPAEVAAAEIDWLRAAIYPGAPDVSRYELTAWTRYSEREWGVER